MRIVTQPDKESIFGLLPNELGARFGKKAALSFRRLQRPHTYENGAPVIGRTLREAFSLLDDQLPAVAERFDSKDGASRFVLRTFDGHLFETVVMPRATKNPRTTLCLSSQIGCAMGCTFCATGKMGIVRHLSAGEIVGQVHRVLLETTALHGTQLNLVFMGMGEPLHNLDEVMRAISVLTHEQGLGVAMRRTTVSTSGLVPEIDRLAAFPARPRLAVSINHSRDEARSKVMPVNRKYPLATLRAALLRFPASKSDRITLEYVLLAGENDSDDDAARLSIFAKGLHCHVNLIPLNTHEGTAFQRPGDDALRRFYDALARRGTMVYVRESRGQDVAAACGQLATKILPVVS